MRYLPMLVVITLVFCFAIAIASIASADPLNVRPVDPLAAETLAHAVARSPTVRSLLAALGQTNVIVHIQTSTAMPAGLGGMTRFVTSRGGYRYLRVTIRADVVATLRGVILGHELRHACEVAQSQANDIRAVEELFERTGERSGNYFETRAAVETERHVRLELTAKALQTEPVIKFHH